MLEQLPERLSSKIVIDPSGCWLWTASLRGGYGQFGVDGTTRAAHRVVYEMLVGAVPDGLELDHTCRVRLTLARALYKLRITMGIYA